ncbi:hypothetical protein EVAR_99558_1 [Eumeta japonica]|uniref:Uncharacterized protein n=1 Tax=Eumeta variegata TaxID=151549 RepID=A0A4C1YYC2_EUMVA|nr:hypothetical protein EVAR_99558_1 [Eumeta japonica]
MSSSSRDQSPCPSVASKRKCSSSAISSGEVPDQSNANVKGSDEGEGPFLTSTLKRKARKVARRQRKINGARSSNFDMEIDVTQEKSINKIDRSLGRNYQCVHQNLLLFLFGKTT